MTEPARKQQRYLVYLLRLWQEGGEAADSARRPAVWRASLQSPQSEESRGFASLVDLFIFLEGVTGSSSRGSDGSVLKER